MKTLLFLSTFSLSCLHAEEAQQCEAGDEGCSAQVPLVTKDTSPNILIVLWDDLGWSDLGYHDAEFSTPVMDSYAKQGIDLTNYYVAPVCTPTRTSIFAGRFPWHVGMNMALEPGSPAHLPFEQPTMFEILKNAGYATYMAGKWHLGYAAWNMTPTARGFDSFHGLLQGEGTYRTHIFHGGYDYWKNQTLDREGGADGQYTADLIYGTLVNDLQNYMDSGTSKPLFYYVALQTIHVPLEQPPSVETDLYDECDTLGFDDRKTTCKQIKYADYLIGEMIKEFEKHGLWDNTLLLVSSDNGGLPYLPPLNFPGAPVPPESSASNMPYRAGKSTSFHGGQKVVGFLSGPLIPEGVRGTESDLLLHGADWYPTIIQSVAKVPIDEDVIYDGTDAWSALTQGANWDRTRLILDCRDAGEEGAVIDGKWKFIAGKQAYDMFLPVPESNKRHKTKVEVSTKTYLFDLSTDPYESTCIAHLNLDVVEQMRQILADEGSSATYVPNQSNEQAEGSGPENFDGVWAPYLD